MGLREASTGRVGALVTICVAAVLLLAGCSTDSAGPTPSSTDSAAPAAWTERTAVRGERVLVPTGWEQHSIDGGGSGSSTIWVDPGDPGRWISVGDGVEAGTWCGVDGVAGSIDPTAMFPTDAAIDELEPGAYSFSYPGAEGNEDADYPGLVVAPDVARGVWMASPSCDGYVELTYALPGEAQATIDAMLAHFQDSNRLSSQPHA